MTEPRRPRRRLWIAIAIAMPVAAMVAWNVAGRLHREAPHTSRYLEQRDLPPLPDPADNGWPRIIESPPSHFEPEPPTRELLAPGEGPPSLERLEAAREDLEAWSIPAEGEEAIDQALARPRFVPACPLRLEEACPVMPWLHAHRAAAALALRDATLGWDEEALTRTAALLRADRDALLHSRSLIEAMVAVTNAAEAIELVAMLGAVLGAREEAAATPDLLAALDAVEIALGELEPGGWSLERALIGEAIRIQSALAALGSTEGSEAVDRGRIARLLDEHFAALLAYAQNPELDPPPPPSAGWLWRALDPAGATALEVLVPDLAPHVERFDESATAAEDRVAAARVTIAAARARMELAPTAE